MNRTDMIFDLSSIWATAKEVFPYFDRLQVDWDERYRTYLEKILQVSDEGEFHRLLTEFMECLKDGHTKYFPPAAYFEFFLEFFFQLTVSFYIGSSSLPDGLSDQIQMPVHFPYTAAKPGTYIHLPESLL